MKKLLLIGVFAMLSIATYAQSGVKAPLAVGDTLGKNTGATQVNKFISATGGYSGATIQVVLTSQSGTPAGGISLYQSTSNGAKYDRLLPSSAADSVVLSSTALSYTWKIIGPVPNLIKVHATNSGTQNTLITVWYALKKYQTQ